jgi:hypothetical protein
MFLFDRKGMAQMPTQVLPVIVEGLGTSFPLLSPDPFFFVIFHIRDESETDGRRKLSAQATHSVQEHILPHSH